MNVSDRMKLSEDLVKLAREVEGEQDLTVFFATLLALNANENFLRNLEEQLRFDARQTPNASAPKSLI